jgi:hypothetical protein
MSYFKYVILSAVFAVLMQTDVKQRSYSLSLLFFNEQMLRNMPEGDICLCCTVNKRNKKWNRCLPPALLLFHTICYFISMILHFEIKDGEGVCIKQTCLQYLLIIHETSQFNSNSFLIFRIINNKYPFQIPNHTTPNVYNVRQWRWQ